MQTVNNNKPEQINSALFAISDDITKQNIQTRNEIKSSEAAMQKQIDKLTDSLKNNGGLITGGTYNINISGNASTATKATNATNADKATQDSAGNTIATTYATKAELDKKAVPTKTSQLTNDSGFVTSGQLAKVATTGSYSDLSNKPTIPTNTNQLTNGAGYITSSGSITGNAATADNATKANHATTADTAITAATANKIEPNYTSVELTEVTSNTTKYIKLADCNWHNTGTLQVYLGGNNLSDTLVINFGGGNSNYPMLCGHYSGNSQRVYSVIAQKGSTWSSDYSIYVKVRQATNLTVNVALLTGRCTIGISESTTAPTNISEWPVIYGLFGNIASPEITSLEQRVAALESKI